MKLIRKFQEIVEFLSEEIRQAKAEIRRELIREAHRGQE